ncbi:hypothetical protein AAF712_004614 [Marasmius tenuissimus]|uniref:Pheromone receptor n=1 Tax=Marasmius tenuissimus TaxID=585030 RepID=A0ABR3A5F2_9AGAR
MSLVVWLVVGNLIHGVNSLVWSGNTDIHIPVWCDIVTKVLLAVAFALPASCFCMAANLELLASKRPLVDTESARRKRLVFTIIICWVAPVIYTLLHFIVQHHRFDIIRDFGCTAAIHSSAASVLVVWLPPFILSIGSFVLCGRSLHHSFRVSASQFEQHIHTRLGMSSSLYLRRMISVLVLTLAVTTISIFTLFARTDFRSFASWEALHIQFTKIFVLGESPDHKLALMMWWLTPVVSIAYVFLWLTVGQDLRDVVKAMKEGEITFPSLPRPRLPRVRAILPTHFRKQGRAKPSAVHRPRPVAPVLVSGWDEMLDMHSVNSSSRSSPSPPPPNKSPRPSLIRVSQHEKEPNCTPTKNEDKSFTASTMEFLSSPTARNLGLNSPILSPPPVYNADKLHPHKDLSKPPAVPDDVASAVSSIHDIPWPSPPSTVPRVQPMIPKRPSCPQSPAFSDISFAGSNPLRRSITPPNMRSPPFRGSSLSSIPSQVSVDRDGKDTYRTKLERLHQNLNLGLSPTDGGVKRKPSTEVFYMTVVTHETS